MNVVMQHAKYNSNKAVVVNCDSREQAIKSASACNAYQAKKLKALAAAIFSDIESMTSSDIEFAIIDLYSSLVGYTAEVT